MNKHRRSLRGLMSNLGTYRSPSKILKTTFFSYALNLKGLRTLDIRSCPLCARSLRVKGVLMRVR